MKRYPVSLIIFILKFQLHRGGRDAIPGFLRCNLNLNGFFQGVCRGSLECAFCINIRICLINIIQITGTRITCISCIFCFDNAIPCNDSFLIFDFSDLTQPVNQLLAFIIILRKILICIRFIFCIKIYVNRCSFNIQHIYKISFRVFDFTLKHKLNAGRSGIIGILCIIPVFFKCH